jgi:hypothetical protein
MSGTEVDWTQVLGLVGVFEKVWVPMNAQNYPPD